MASYVVVGASRGLGYEFLRQLSQNRSNTVIGLARDKNSTDKRLAKDGLSHVTIVSADMTDLASLRKASTAAAELLDGGGLDYLINNAAIMPERSGLVDMTYLYDVLSQKRKRLSEAKHVAPSEENPEILTEDLLETFRTNVVGVANAIIAFLPLIKIGKTKKVIAISTGMADLDLTNDYSLYMGAPYSTSKAAVNMLVAKYNATYAPQGILFMSISPGLVDTSEGKPVSPKVFRSIAPMFEAFKKYNPDFAGPITSQESVEHILKIATRATIQEFGGKFVSHFGNNQWL